MGDLAALDRPDLSALQRNDGNGLAVQRYEFHFVRLSIMVDMNDGAVSFLYSGYAVMSRGGFPESTIHTVRTLGALPSGDRNANERAPARRASEASVICFANALFIAPLRVRASLTG